MIRFRISKDPVLDAIKVVVDHNQRLCDLANDARTCCSGEVAFLALPVAVTAIHAQSLVGQIIPGITGIRTTAGR